RGQVDRGDHSVIRRALYFECAVRGTVVALRLKRPRPLMQRVRTSGEMTDAAAGSCSGSGGWPTQAHDLDPGHRARNGLRLLDSNANGHDVVHAQAQVRQPLDEGFDQIDMAFGK